MNTESMLRKLVGFDTTSRESNLALIDFVSDYLEGHGVDSRLVMDEEGTKANLWATIGPDTADGVILSGHTDCVPVDEQPWSTDPFTLTATGDRWFGRGTSDMKTFIAAALAAVPAFAAGPLRRPVHLALSYDEEVGGAGARGLVSDLAARGVAAESCVVGEPTSMRVVVAHKGIFVFEAEVRGSEAHSSLAPRAVNASEYAARLLVEIQDLGREKAAAGPFDDGFDVTHTTFHAGVIEGGIALNIVPRRARLEFEFRHLPGDEPGAIRDRIDRIVSRLNAEMAESNEECGLDIEQRAHLPALDTAPDSAVVAAVRPLTDAASLGKVAYGTEAALFAGDLGVPTVVCGPGSIEQAHKPDEYIEVSQVTACDRFMERLAGRLAAD
ncbi:MAG: acetylornithine deacetylase [Acidimicrobiia bacterium]